MVHLEGERERNRATKITQANFHPKRCQPRHKSSLNKQKNNNNNKTGKKNIKIKKKNPYHKDSPKPTIGQRVKDSFILLPQL